MNALKDIINNVADEADELLGESTSIEQAREDLQEHMAQHYPKLSKADSKAAVAGVLEILKREGFFEGSRSADGFGDEGSEGFAEEE